jgi:AAA+ superfamily predicted ATPase
MLNLNELCTYFRAGISVVAIDSPTAAENAVLQALAVEFQAGRMVQTWDCRNQLQTVALRVDETAAVVGIERKPDVNFKSQGHPVEAILKHIIQQCQAPLDTSAKILFVLKDLSTFVTGANANPVLVRTLKDCCFALKRSRHRLVLLHDGWPPPLEFQDLMAVMQHSLPGEGETRDILQQRITMLQQAATLAERTVQVNLAEAGYQRLVRSLLGMTQEAMEDTLQLVITRDGTVDESTIAAIAAIKQQRFATQGVEYAQAPDVAVQGMPNLSSWAKTLAKLLEPVAQLEWQIPFPKGVLLAGEGGTGKTLAVKCLAQELGLPVIVLDTSKLMQKELGASEENLRRIIAAAEAMAPSILFIDEMDKGLGNAESDGGTSSRMFGYLLQWFQEHQSAVFVAATVNEPWRLKPELLRRFSKAFLVDLPDIAARRSIFQVQIAKFKLAIPDHDLQTLAEQTPDFTGDEIRKVVHECAAAAYAAGHPGEVSMAMYLAQIDRKEPQFRNNRDRLAQLRAWMSAGNAEPMRDAQTHPDLQHDRVTAVEFV